MTKRQRLRRLAKIKLLAEGGGPHEQGSDARAFTEDESARVRLNAEAAGAEWVARHRGLAGYDLKHTTVSGRPIPLRGRHG